MRLTVQIIRAMQKLNKNFIVEIGVYASKIDNYQLGHITICNPGET